MDILNYLRTWKDTKKGNYLILALVIIFLSLTAVVYFLPTSVVDIEFSEEVQEHMNPLLDFLMKAVSWFGRTWISVTMVTLAALSFFLANYKKEALFVLLTLLVSPINTGIKLLISRPRPTADLVTIVQEAQHQSFPSGHVSFYVAFFGFLVFLMLRHHHIPNSIRYAVIIFSLLLILSVPVSRVYLGVHWFTDVTGGFVLGLLFLYGLIMLYLKKTKRNNKSVPE